ncbi:COG3772 Phage-related lysozyme (muraminidase) [uncultured Caudovirales phage]|uniref:Endolysin n=1 Tax=uncultured Caudovirales phage TaxID=2100421 RepID=A0A6J5RV31_9CAUD|nr:endolysin [uncultured Caudovirales phage]CAB4202343.1 COG3772 Phage-related lysozyme (muraminidase) [uncultured Caudovirales phage]
MINDKTIALIKKFEGCKLKSYLCPANVWTIGYGHTKGVLPGTTITQQEAESLLFIDLLCFESAVAKMVIVPITANQCGALISFSFNVGKAALRNSMLLQYVNSKDPHAADEFLKWNKATVNGVKKILPGLTARRIAERELFLMP